MHLPVTLEDLRQFARMGSQAPVRIVIAGDLLSSGIAARRAERSQPVSMCFARWASAPATMRAGGWLPSIESSSISFPPYQT